MTKKKVEQMFIALSKIHKHYCTPAQLRKDCKKQIGLEFYEAIEMAYENIQLEAKAGLKGITRKQINKIKPEKRKSAPKATKEAEGFNTDRFES